MKFKKGDRVRVKSAKTLLRGYKDDEELADDLHFVDPMFRFCDKVATIIRTEIYRYPKGTVGYVLKFDEFPEEFIEFIFVEEVLEELEEYEEYEWVNEPPQKTNPHYKTTDIEVIDVIEKNDLNFNLGNAVKYILRAPHKGNKKEDLKKALNYIHREVYGKWYY